MQLEEKIAEIRGLIAQRDEIDAQLSDLLTAGPKPLTVLDKPRKQGAPGRKKGARTCKECGKPGHIAKTCPVNRGAAPVSRFNQSVARLTEDQFDELKQLQLIGELSSLEFSVEHSIDLGEVNRAITSRTFNDYMNS